MEDFWGITWFSGEMEGGGRGSVVANIVGGERGL